jgi:tetratricopeptide (TPR) repeat protein
LVEALDKAAAKLADLLTATDRVLMSPMSSRDPAIVKGFLASVTQVIMAIEPVLNRLQNQVATADASLTEAIGILAKTPSGQYAQALQFHGNLARAQGRLDLAAQRYRASFEAFRAVTGDSVYTWLTALEVVSALGELGRLDEADALAAQAVAAMAKPATAVRRVIGSSAGLAFTTSSPAQADGRTRG